MSTTIENSGTISATIGAGVIGTLLPETITAGTTPIKLLTTYSTITATSSTSPSFPSATKFTAEKAGKYRFYFVISSYATRSGSSGTASCSLYFRYKLTPASGEETVSPIRTVTATTSTATAARAVDYTYVDITLGVGDSVSFGGYKLTGNCSSSSAAVYDLFVAIDWDNGF